MLAPIGMPVRGLAWRGHIARGPSRAQMVVVLSGSIILAQIVVPGAAAVLAQLNKLNSVCMPLRYIWVFVACILLKKAGDRFGQEYKFTKGKVLGAWCLFVTLVCRVFGKYSEGPSP